MTLLAALAAAVVLLALPGALDALGRTLRPQEWAKMSTIGLCSGLALLEVVLILRAVPTLLRAAGIPSLATACERVVQPLLAGGSALGWLAALGAVLLPSVAAMQWRKGRRVRARVVSDLWLGDHRLIAGEPVVVLAIARPIAVSIEHRGAKWIIVSHGLLDGLDDEQIEAVIRHEASHLDHGHQRMLTAAGVAQGILGWLPVVARTVGAIHLAVERWADEDAASSAAGGRRAVRDSLVRLADVAPFGDLVAFTDAATVAARVSALESPAPVPRLPQHLALYLPGSLAGAVAAPGLVSWGGHLQMVVAMSGRCSF